PTYEAPGESDFDNSFDTDIDGAAAAPRPDTAPIASAYPEASGSAPENASRNDRGDRNDRNNRGDRNNRNDRGGRGERGGRDDRGGRHQRNLRVPRGFAPKTALYGVDNSNESPELDASTPEPIILPGESLSK